jgi:hypothetical protein
MLASPDAEVRKDIIRALSSARSKGAYTLLLETAQKSTENSEKILSLRGFLETLSSMDGLSSSERVDGFRAAWPLATRQEEKNAILSAAKAMKSKLADKFVEEFAPSNRKTEPKA